MSPQKTRPESSSSDAARFASLLETIAQHQDRDAFGELFAHFAPRVKGYLLRLGASDGQAEEITQDAMLTIWRKAHLFDPKKAAASTWIFTIARNRRIDILRRQKYPELDANDPMLVPDAPAQPDEEVIGARRDERVRAALQKLPDEQRELVRLAFYNGWSHGELAEQTNLPLGTVKSRLRLAFGRLRQELDAEK
ncbi:sigma-70 family RNA polymerase sigma factor [Alphaproteobacteria bacterium]|nr:sigma-70 family RNA polymerase sigma factor [Alphaproteobacteria bacterium]